MLANAWSFLSAWYNLPFTILLAVCALLAVLQLIGLGGEVVLGLRISAGLGDDFLARGAEAAQRARAAGVRQTIQAQACPTPGRVEDQPLGSGRHLPGPFSDSLPPDRA